MTLYLAAALPRYCQPITEEMTGDGDDGDYGGGDGELPHVDFLPSELFDLGKNQLQN